MKKLKVTAKEVEVSIKRTQWDALEIEVHFDASTTDPDEFYSLEAGAKSFDLLRVLVKAAEPEGSATQVRVLEVLTKVEELWLEWESEGKEKR